MSGWMPGRRRAGGQRGKGSPRARREMARPIGRPAAHDRPAAKPQGHQQAGPGWPVGPVRPVLPRSLEPIRRKPPSARDWRRTAGAAALVALSALTLLSLYGLAGTLGPERAPRAPLTEPPATVDGNPAPSGSAPGRHAVPDPTTPTTGVEAPAGPSLAPSRSSTVPATARPSPGVEATRPPGAAPAEPDEFDPATIVVDIAFPLRADTRYAYRDNFADLRPGRPETYNHAFDRRRDRLRRAHDGIDIYAPVGAPVLAPFDGHVINPARRWRPWRADRHGIVVVIVSEEPQSAGYVALLSHLDASYVEPGTGVRRGEVVGTIGRSGNAESAESQLHFELRAPFAIPWTEAGQHRLLDAFNPFASLRAADPSRK